VSVRSTFSGYCKCGGYIKFTGDADMGLSLIRKFETDHKGEGHRPTTSKACHAARKSADDKAAKEMPK